jgi:hypothetical protein
MLPTATAVSDHVQAAVLDEIAGGMVLIGTTDTLARAYGVTVTVFLSALRDLLEAGRITVQMESHGQVSVRLDDRYTSPADRPV